ncbi:YrzI family small protein [Bacillus carboniphilus]|uniref:YrzI family small protein n=1 Tax=Bacillus carboniphilus TaxID=86663 RepID=A0ABY9JUY0_9BACI|nr:YrzI family small protein [Bacillus carboniphilus]WLR42108.1 YrzI family small protein [Bacillus carboniphilus]
MTINLFFVVVTVNRREMTPQQIHHQQHVEELMEEVKSKHSRMFFN